VLIPVAVHIRTISGWGIGKGLPGEQLKGSSPTVATFLVGAQLATLALDKADLHGHLTCSIIYDLRYLWHPYVTYVTLLCIVMQVKEPHTHEMPHPLTFRNLQLMNLLGVILNDETKSLGQNSSGN